METKGLFLIGAVLIGGYLAITTLKDVDLAGVVVDAPGGLKVANNTPRKADSVPEDFLKETPYWVNAEGPVAAHETRPAVFVTDAIPGWRPADKREVVGTIQLINPSRNCSMPAPVVGARVANLFVRHPRQEAGLWSFAEAEVLKSVRKWYDGIRNSEAGKSPRLPGPTASHEFKVHDVAVTETDRPVHLVLRNAAAGNVLYNIHLAPGARVAGVSMLGGEANAVANLPRGTPVAAMDDATLRACGATQVFARSVNFVLEAGIKADKLTGEREEKARAEAAAKIAGFNDWFEAQFGINADETLFGLAFGNVSLVGPMPTDPDQAPAYAPLADAYVVAQTERFFKVAGLHEWPKAYMAEVQQAGTMLAGGDPLTVVKPEFYTTEW